MKGYNPTKFSNKVTIAFLKGINYRKDLLSYDISKHEAINRLKNVNFKTFIIECKLRKKDMAQNVWKVIKKQKSKRVDQEKVIQRNYL